MGHMDGAIFHVQKQRQTQAFHLLGIQKKHTRKKEVDHMNLNINTLAERKGYTEQEFQSKIDSILSKENDYFKGIEKIMHNPSITERLFPNTAMKHATEYYMKIDDGMKEWEELTGSQYPFLNTDNGDRVNYYYLNEDIPKEEEYHIPDYMCATRYAREFRDEMEAAFKEQDIHIPQEIGEKLEDVFKSPGDTWIHRTQIGSEHTKLLGDIAEKGLICAANDLENTATPMTNYLTFVQQVAYGYSYRQDSCKGIVIVKTDDEPRIEDHHLLPDQIAGFVGNDFGHLHDFVTKADMLEYTKEETLDLDKVSEKAVEKETFTVDQLIAEAKEELKNDNHSILNVKEMDLEPIGAR